MPAAYVIVWARPDWPTEDGMGVRLKILEGKSERAGHSPYLSKKASAGLRAARKGNMGGSEWLIDGGFAR